MRNRRFKLPYLFFFIWMSPCLASATHTIEKIPSHIASIDSQVISSQVIASQVIPFHTDDRIELPLSLTDMNRIRVAGDRIKRLTYPGNCCRDIQDSDGGSFLQVLTAHPFTLYVSTIKHQHLSLHVLPKKAAGSTVVFQPIHQQKKQPKRHKKTYTRGWVDEIVALMHHKMPSNFHRKPVPSLFHPLKPGVSIKALQRYDSPHYQATIYRIAASDYHTHPLHLKDFNLSHVRALSLSSKLVNYKHSAYLYVITNKPKETSMGAPIHAPCERCHHQHLGRRTT